MANPAANARAQAQTIWSGATIAERGPGFIRHAHPTDNSRFMIDSQVGQVMHLADLSEADSDFVATAAPGDAPYTVKTTNAHMDVLFSPGNDELNVPDIIQWRKKSSGETVGLTFEDLEYENDVGGLELISSPVTISPDATPIGTDTIVYSGAYGTGFDLTLFADLVRMRKELRFTRGDLPTPTLANVEWVRLTVRFNVSSGVDVFINGSEWGAGNPPDTEAAGAVEFRDSGTSEVLWTFKSPYIQNETTADPDDNPTVTSWYRKTGPNLRVQIYVDYAWLLAQPLTDVLMLDPTIEDQVGESVDDAHEKQDDTTFQVDQSLNYISSTTGTSATYIVGTRHTVADIASGDTIDVGYLVLYARPGRTGQIGTMYFEDVDDAANFTTNADLVNRTKTTASDAWDFSYNTHTSPTNSDTLITGLQEVIDRAGWAAGQAVMTLWDGTTASSLDGTAEAWDVTAGEAPLLHIEYTAAAGGTAVKDMIGGMGIIAFAR